MRKQNHHSLLILIFLLFSSIINAQTNKSFIIGDLRYVVVDSITNDVFVIVKNNEISGDLIIPEYVEYEGDSFRVTSVYDRAFYNCSQLNSVTLPNSVVSIGKEAFSGCSSLTTIHLPDSITAINDYTFCNTGLESITIPNAVSSIGQSAFYACKNLTSIVFPDSLKSIGASAFSECLELEQANLPNSVTEIGHHAFNVCEKLETVNIPSSLTSIEPYTFYRCSTLTSVKIPESVITIGTSSFHQCIALSSVTLSNSVTTIGSYAFSLCSSLSQIDIPSSVTTIENSAFMNCYAMSIIKLPSSVTTIGENAFHDFKLVCYDGDATGSPWGAWIVKKNPFFDGDYIYEDETKHRLVAYTGTEADVIIPDSITEIGEFAFLDCENLTTLELPESIKTIDQRAFVRCGDVTYNSYANAQYLGNKQNPYLYLLYSTIDTSSIEINYHCKVIGTSALSNKKNMMSVHIPNSVTRINSYAFAECDRLSSIVLPNSITHIDSFAFSNCTNLLQVTIPSSVTYMGANVFNGCLKLRSSSNTNKPSMLKKATTYDNSIYCQVTERPDEWDSNWISEDYQVQWNAPFVTLTAESNNDEYGSISYAGSYLEETEATLIAHAAEGYHFVKWENGDTDSIRTVLATASETYKAIFEEYEVNHSPSIVSSNDMEIITGDKVLIVKNATEEIFVFKTSGKILFHKHPDSPLVEIAIPVPGIYIIVVGNSSQQVIIK